MRFPFLLIAAPAAIGWLAAGGPAVAACTFSPTLGDDVFICDSGTSAAGLVDTAGNNTLLLPSGGTGIVNGNVTFGAGADRIDVASGTIQGAVDQGGGADAFVMSGGSVTGNVQQGVGIDDFRMTGGTIGSLNQGDGLDTFFMSGGRIVDFFDDGDRAVMTGGQIGRVNMRLDRNFFDMSGGIIDRNLVTGFDIDTIVLSGGFIGGNISVSGGADSVTVTGGTLVGSVLMSTGADSFVWDSGGSIAGTIDMGIDNDMARLANLAAANIGATAAIDGGLGTDALTLQNVVATGIARFANWETIDATQGTALTFDGTLVLGDAGTGTGALSVDAASTLFGGGGNFGIAGFSTGASLLNAGRIDLTNGITGPEDSFTITGDYTGDGGSLRLETTLGNDASPSDRLVVSGGTASGTTGIDIVNSGGAGAVTNLDGILLVDAINGGTTSGSAFSLASRVAAGPYEYLLFRGGVSAGSDQNWYLRSTIVPGPQPAPPPPGAPPPSPGATPQAGEFVPLYRPEVATYSAIVPVGHHLALSALGTFHERRGDQPLLGSAGALPSSWVRVYGRRFDAAHGGAVTPAIDGSMAGFQVGQDLFGRESEGTVDRFGVFIGRAGLSGDVTGRALGWTGLSVGDVEADAIDFGGYWTRVGRTGWYLDAVLIASRFDGEARSVGGEAVDISGSGFTASLETGIPIELSPGWTLEPQAQLIWQSLSFSDRQDRFSTVALDADDIVTGRIGLRLAGRTQAGGVALRPYLKANIWHDFDGSHVARFGATDIATEFGGTRLEFGGGVVADFTDAVSAFATAGYTTDVGGATRGDAIEGTIGLRIKW